MKPCLVLILSVFLIQKPMPSKLSLEDFVFLKEDLPEGVLIKSVKGHAPLPCHAESNPFISSERNFVDCIANYLVQDSTLNTSIKRGLFSVYEGKFEIGVIGLEADSKKTAKTILDILTENNKNYAGSALYQSGKIVIWLWKDNGLHKDDEKNTAFNAFKTLIADRMKA